MYSKDELKRPAVKPKDSLADALEEISTSKMRLRSMKDKHNATYEKPKPKPEKVFSTNPNYIDL